jgi:hypothetical protein
VKGIRSDPIAVLFSLYIACRKEHPGHAEI